MPITADLSKYYFHYIFILNKLNCAVINLCHYTKKILNVKSFTFALF